MKHAKELAAMDAELRHIVSGVGAAQFVPHDLTETIAVDQFADLDTSPLQRGKQAKSRQNSGGMRLHVDADAELADLVCLFEYLGIDAGLTESQRCGQTANAATNNQDPHRLSPFAMLETRRGIARHRWVSCRARSKTAVDRRSDRTACRTAPRTRCRRASGRCLGACGRRASSVHRCGGAAGAETRSW